MAVLASLLLNMALKPWELRIPLRASGIVGCRAVIAKKREDKTPSSLVPQFSITKLLKVRFVDSVIPEKLSAEVFARTLRPGVM